MFKTEIGSLFPMKHVKIIALIGLAALAISCQEEAQDGVVMVFEPTTDRQITVDEEPSTPDQPTNEIPFIGDDGDSESVMPESSSTCDGLTEQVCPNGCGLQICQNGVWSDCRNSVERCNGHDDDCDGQPDENLGVGMS